MGQENPAISPSSVKVEAGTRGLARSEEDAAGRAARRLCRRPVPWLQGSAAPAPLETTSPSCRPSDSASRKANSNGAALPKRSQAGEPEAGGENRLSLGLRDTRGSLSRVKGVGWTKPRECTAVAEVVAG